MIIIVVTIAFVGIDFFYFFFFLFSNRVDEPLIRDRLFTANPKHADRYARARARFIARQCQSDRLGANAKTRFFKSFFYFIRTRITYYTNNVRRNNTHFCATRAIREKKYCLSRELTYYFCSV